MLELPKAVAWWVLKPYKETIEAAPWWLIMLMLTVCYVSLMLLIVYVIS